MEPTKQIRAAEMARGAVIKRRNAVTTILTGVAFSSASLYLFGWNSAAIDLLWLAGGVLAGILYANAFEYTLHRFALHWGNGFLVQRHALHHSSAGTPDEARYVNFATSPLVVILVFALNALPVFALAPLVERSARGGLAASMFVGFTIYFVLYEEIHWRIHFAGWLPYPMRFARRHHMQHHRGVHGHYNVFLPIFDWIFHHKEWQQE